MRILFAVFLFFSLVKGENMVSYLDVNGAKIPVISEISKNLPIGFIQLIFKGSGSINEPKVGLANIASGVLDKGSKKRGEYEFANELEKNAISLSVSSGVENLSFSLDFLSQKESIALDLLDELLRSPNATNSVFKQVKLNTQSYILGLENDFDHIGAQNLKALIFKGSALEFPSFGTMEALDSIKLGDVEDFIEENLILENVVILIGGDLDLAKTKEKLKKILEKLPNGKKQIINKIAPLVPNKMIVTVKPETKQAYIYFAAPFTFKKYESELHKASVMSFIIGASGFGSRILEEIRVKRGLAYSANARAVISNITSYFSGHLQTSLANKDNAIKAVRETIKEFIAKGATQAELDDAKAYLVGSMVLSDETFNSRLGKKYANFSKKLPLDYDKIIVDKIKNLSLKELNDYIKSHSEINNLSFSIVSDK